MPSRLLVPRDTMKGNPATVEAYVALAMANAERAGRTLIDDKAAIAPCVNGGQWVFRCPYSEGFSPCDPEWPIACCFNAGCYHVFSNIVVPDRDTRHAIEAELEQRPRRRQHWGFARAMAFDPQGAAETVEELQAERLLKRDLRADDLAQLDVILAPAPIDDSPIDPVVVPEGDTL